MVLVRLSLTLAALMVGNVQGQWTPGETCEGCLEASDDFQLCLETYTCDSDAILRSPNMRGVATTCGMGTLQDGNHEIKCRETGDKLDQCMRTCLPECILEETQDYFQCAANSAECNIEDCVTKIALNQEWLDRADDGEFFEKLGEELTEISMFETDCDGTDDKAKKVCEIGELCCGGCNEELGAVMHCVVNELVRPYQYGLIYTDGDVGEFSSSDECENIAEKNGKEACTTLLGERRKLTDVVNSTMTTMPEVSPEAAAAAEKCVGALNVAIGTNDVTNGADTFVNCVSVEGARLLESGDEETEDAGTDSGAPNSVISAAFLVVAAASVFV